MIQCADVIVTLGNKFVIVERLASLPGFALPGGKCDPGETPKETACRELFEETGLTCAIYGEVGYFDVSGRDPRGSFASTVFHGIAEGVPCDEPGKTRVRLMTRDEIIANKQRFVADHGEIICAWLLKEGSK